MYTRYILSSDMAVPTGGRHPRHLGKFGPGWLLDSACGRDRTKEHMANSLRAGCEDGAWVGTPNSTHLKKRNPH